MACCNINSRNSSICIDTNLVVFSTISFFLSILCLIVISKFVFIFALLLMILITIINFILSIFSILILVWRKNGSIKHTTKICGEKLACAGFSLSIINYIFYFTELVLIIICFIINETYRNYFTNFIIGDFCVFYFLIVTSFGIRLWYSSKIRIKDDIDGPIIKLDQFNNPEPVMTTRYPPYYRQIPPQYITDQRNEHYPLRNYIMYNMIYPTNINNIDQQQNYIIDQRNEQYDQLDDIINSIAPEDKNQQQNYINVQGNEQYVQRDGRIRLTPIVNKSHRQNVDQLKQGENNNDDVKIVFSNPNENKTSERKMS